MNHLVTISSPKSEEKLGHLVYRSRNWQISLRQQLIEPQEKLNPIVFVHISCHLFDIFCQLLVRVTAVRKAPQKRSKCCQPADSYGRCVKKCFTMVGCGWKDDVTMFPCPASSKWPFSSPPEKDTQKPPKKGSHPGISPLLLDRCNHHQSGDLRFAAWWMWHYRLNSRWAPLPVVGLWLHL